MIKKLYLFLLLCFTVISIYAEKIPYNVPGELSYEGAEFWFLRDGDKTNSTVIGNFCSNNTMTGAFFKINVTEEAEYVLYLNSAGKGQQLSTDIRNKFDVFIDKGTAEERKVVFLDEVNPGNANIYMMIMVDLGTLTEGEHDLQINKTAADWIANPDAGPVILKKDHYYDFEALNSTELLNIDVLHPHITSDNRNFTTYVWYRMENSVFGPKDNKGILVTDDSKVAHQPNASDVKSYSPVTPTRLRYKVEVDKAGKYPVKMTGQFTLAHWYQARPAEYLTNNTVISDYRVRVTGTWNNKEAYNADDIIFPDIDPNEDGMLVDASEGRDLTKEITATGYLNLNPGTYYLELTAVYNPTYPWPGGEQMGEDMLSLRTFEIGAPIEIIEDADPVGKGVPVVSLEEIPETVYWGYGFTLSGNVRLDDPENESLTSLQLYKDGEILSSSIIPDEDGNFSVEIPAIEGEEKEYTFKVVATTSDGVKSSKSIVLDINKKQFDLMVFIEGEGEVTSDTGLGYKVKEFEDVTLTFTPADRYRIKEVKIDDAAVTLTDNKYTIKNVRERHTVDVEFEKYQFEITMAETSNGSIGYAVTSGSGYDNLVELGSSIEISATPELGYHLSAIRVNEETKDFNVGEDGIGKTIVNNISEDITVKASFEINTYTVTSSVSGSGGRIDVAPTVQYGSDLLIKVIPDGGYHINTFKVDGNNVEFTATENGTGEYLVKNVTSDINIEASFSINVYNVTATTDGTGGKVTASSTTVEHGGSVSFVITPDPGYFIKSIKVNNTDLSGFTKTGHTYLHENSTGDITLTASFEKTDGIEAIEAEGVTYSLINGGILITSTDERAIRLIALDGTTLFNEKIIGEKFIQLSYHGIFIMTVGNKSVKISI